MIRELPAMQKGPLQLQLGEPRCLLRVRSFGDSHPSLPTRTVCEHFERVAVGEPAERLGGARSVRTRSDVGPPLFSKQDGEAGVGLP